MDRTARSAPPNQEEPGWNATHMLDVHILDYFKKRNLHETAAAFKNECKVSDRPCAIEAPSGFLFEWWSVFWDIYISRTNPSFSECASTYSKVQKAKIPNRQQQLQQQVQQQQHQMLQQQLMREKDLRPDDAAQYAQQIMAGRIRISELGALSSTANQEHLAAGLKGQLDEAGRGPEGSLPSPSLEGSLDLQQRQQLLAAFQASKRAASQSKVRPGQGLEQHRVVTPQTPIASPTPSHPNAQTNKQPGFAHALMHPDAFQPSVGAAMLSTNAFPPEMRQQAIQKLQLQYLHHQHQQQQQQHQQGEQQQHGALHRALSADLSGQLGSSRQSSGTIQRHSLSPTMPAQQQLQQPQQPQQPGLTPQQMMLLHHMQQSGESMKGQLHMPEAEVQRRLLAQISSQGLLKPAHRFDTLSLGNALSGEGTAASPGMQNSLRTQQQQQLHQQHVVAEMQRAHQQQQAHQQQVRAGSQLGMLPSSHADLEPGQQSTPHMMDAERQMPSADSRQNRDSPANSTIAGSTLQTGSAIPIAINSSVRNSNRPRGAKPTRGMSNKKRKHSTSTSPSNSGSQDAPSSNVSGGSGSHKGSIKQAPSPSALQHSMDQVTWGHTRMGSASLLNSAGSGMNAAAAALDSSSVNLLHDLMGDGLLDTGLDPLLSLGGEGDPTDAPFM